jgi:hypothetical protein
MDTRRVPEAKKGSRKNTVPVLPSWGGLGSQESQEWWSPGAQAGSKPCQDTWGVP